MLVVVVLMVMMIAMIVVANDCHSDGYCASDGNVVIDRDGNDNIVIGDNGRGF